MSLGQSAKLAPFVDINNDGIYNPTSDGDYPLIKGDQAIFFLFNDDRNIHTETGGQRIDLEIQGLAYAFNCSSDSALQHTMFVHYKMINKSSFYLDSTFIGNWMDMDMLSGSEYIGTDVARGVFYFYGKDSINSSYGNHVPSRAVVFLRGPAADSNGLDDAAFTAPYGWGYGDGIVDNERIGLSKSMVYENNFTVTGNPNGFTNTYQYLTGTWFDGTVLVYGIDGHLSGGMNCDYTFPGTSDPLGYGTSFIPQASWDQSTSGINVDVRALGSYGPFKLMSGQEKEFDFAYVYGRDFVNPGNMQGVEVMNERIDSIRSYFYTNITPCGMNIYANVQNPATENLAFSLYPNPSTNNITIKYKSSSKNYTLKIYDATGRLIKSIDKINQEELNIPIDEFYSGIYLINLLDGNNSLTKRFVKQ